MVGAVYLVSAATADGVVTNFISNNPAARNAIVFFSLPCNIIDEVDVKIDNGNALTGRAVRSNEIDCSLIVNNKAVNADKTVLYYAVAL